MGMSGKHYAKNGVQWEMGECHDEVYQYCILLCSNKWSPCGNIIPTRGVKRGDPLFPYLFLLYAKGLLVLLKNSIDQWLLKAVATCQGGPKISHLLFANDSLIFCRETSEECSNLEKVLETYEKALGKQLNKDKTSLFFSRNTPPSV